jgi:aminodeoxyfutalosine deaminase
MAVVLRSRWVVPVTSAPIENGAVVVEGEQITQVGPWEDIRENRSETVVDLGERILLPGLVNAHCHLDFTMMRHAISPQRTFTEWIQRINALKRSLEDDEYLAAIFRGFSELRKWGTTTVANIESFPELLLHMPPPLIRTWWFFEMIDIRHRNPTEEMVAGALGFFTSRTGWIGGSGISPHSPYTASPAMFELSGRVAEELDMPVTTHVAESREEWEMFRNNRGELHSFMQKLGRGMQDCAMQRSPLAHLAASAQVTGRWLLAHMNELDASDLEWLAQRPYAARPSVVHCPGSHRYFQHSPFPFAALTAAGVNVCLGTDSLASTESLSLFDEMREFARNHPSTSPEAILALATTNGARALGLPVGRVAPGALADLIALPFSGQAPDLYEGILTFRQPVDWMMVNGQLLPEI